MTHPILVEVYLNSSTFYCSTALSFSSTICLSSRVFITACEACLNGNKTTSCGSNIIENQIIKLRMKTYYSFDKRHLTKIFVLFYHFGLDSSSGKAFKVSWPTVTFLSDVVKKRHLTKLLKQSSTFKKTGQLVIRLHCDLMQSCIFGCFCFTQLAECCNNYYILRSKKLVVLLPEEVSFTHKSEQQNGHNDT